MRLCVCVCLSVCTLLAVQPQKPPGDSVSPLSFRERLFDEDDDSCSGRGKGLMYTRRVICAHTCV